MTHIITNHFVIPEHEIEITASRASGPGGQHVNKSSTRITVRWNVKNSAALTNEQKERVLQKLQSQLTTEGDLIMHSGSSRSQQQNKEIALKQLNQKIRQALYIPKKRMKTRTPASAQEARLQEKSHRSFIKQSRRSFSED